MMSKIDQLAMINIAMGLFAEEEDQVVSHLILSVTLLANDGRGGKLMGKIWSKIFASFDES